MVVPQIRTLHTSQPVIGCYLIKRSFPPAHFSTPCNLFADPNDLGHDSHRVGEV